MPPRILIVVHVPWEGPHRIADALTRAGFELDRRCVLAGDDLPDPAGLAGAVFMGGPMGADQADLYPGLATEIEWLARAAEMQLPLLGVCLGSQLLACALGGSVSAGPMPEIGWGEIVVHGDDDLLLSHLAPRSEVLHWHSDVIALPDDACLLASSAQTQVQAFRRGNAWGLLFHAEADLQLTEAWLAEPSMRAEAEAAVGRAGADAILARVAELELRLRELSDPMFTAFAEFARAQRGVSSS